MCIENVILNYNTQTFIFGSKSQFNHLCHLVVTELKEKYSNIKRVCYTCKSETCTLETNIKEEEKFYLDFLKQKVTILGFEEEFEHKTKYIAGKLSYIKRNQAMIDNSDICIFYCDMNYMPTSKTNSGTKIAYEYALKKNKIIINLYK